MTLHASDLKDAYDVQLPFQAYFYLNALTLTTSPGQLLERLRGIAKPTLAASLARIGGGRSGAGSPPAPTSPPVGSRGSGMAAC